MKKIEKLKDEELTKEELRNIFGGTDNSNDDDPYGTATNLTETNTVEADNTRTT